MADIMTLETVHNYQPSSFLWLSHVSSSLYSGEHLEETKPMRCYVSTLYFTDSTRQLALQSCKKSEL